MIQQKTETRQYNTFARLDGLAVLILHYCADFCQVRYIGARGMRITNRPFSVDTEKLSEF